MTVIDSSGWIHYLTNGDLAEPFAKYFSKYEEIVTPTIVFYEVYKKIKQEFSQEEAYLAVSQMNRTRVVPLGESLACHAADISLEHQLAMADAIVYATALAHQATLVTSAADFKGLPKVSYICAS